MRPTPRESSADTLAKETKEMVAQARAELAKKR